MQVTQALANCGYFDTRQALVHFFGLELIPTPTEICSKKFEEKMIIIILHEFWQNVGLKTTLESNFV